MSYMCRICYETADNNEDGSFIHPCTCRGDTKWVHKMCLKKWEAYKIKTDTENKLICEICHTKYNVLESRKGCLSKIAAPIERFYYRMCAFMAEANQNSTVYDRLLIMCIIVAVLVLSQVKYITNINAFLWKYLMVQSLITTCVYIEMFPYEDFLLYILSKLKWLSSCITLFDSFVQMQYGYDNGIITMKVILGHVLQSPTIGGVCNSMLFLYMSNKIGLIFYTVTNVFKRMLFGGLVYVFVRSLIILCIIYNEHKRRFSLVFVETEEKNDDVELKLATTNKAAVVSEEKLSEEVNTVTLSEAGNEHNTVAELPVKATTCRPVRTTAMELALAKTNVLLPSNTNVKKDKKLKQFAKVVKSEIAVANKNTA